MSNELFKQFLDQLSESELRNIVSKSNIPIEGFRSTSNNIPIAKLKSGIVIFLNKYRSKILIQDKDSYLNLQRKNIHSFNLQILHDLYNNINTEVIKNLLDELKNSANFDDKDKSNIEINDLQKINNELIKENNELNKRIKEITKQLKQKQEDFITKTNADVKERSKLEIEIKKLEKRIENLNHEKKEILIENQNLKELHLKNENDINEIKQTNEYYIHLLILQKIIFFRLTPIKNTKFPCEYRIISNLKDLCTILQIEDFSEFWYPEDSLDPFETNYLFDFINKHKINIKMRALDNEMLDLLKLDRSEQL